MSSFPLVQKRKRGYSINQVDDFIQRARVAYESSPENSTMTSVDVRDTSFELVRGGYLPAAVDDALERLEDALAEREREGMRAIVGDSGILEDARAHAREIVARTTRPRGSRLKRAGLFTIGYRRHEVDAFLDHIHGFFVEGKPLAVTQVRQIVFGPERGGYREEQADALLDEVVSVMLQIR